MKQLVVLGGGYGGMRICERFKDEEVAVTLVDRLPYHALKTEYYALAAGTLSDRDVRIAFPEGEHLTYKYGHVVKISPETNSVHLQDGTELFYDDLIIALGCEDKYHNIPGAQEFTYSIQTLEESRKTQQAICGLTPGAVVSIVGAGLSGVELASELHESRKDLKIRLFDRGPSVLSFLSDKVSTYVQEWFEEHDVEVINNSNVTFVTADDVQNGDEAYPSNLTIWTAGTQPVKVVRDLGFEADSGGRIKLTEHHHVPEHENVFVIGDCASLPYAPSGQLAEHQADQVVDVLQAKWDGKKLPKLPEIKLRGMLGSLGKSDGFGIVMGKQALTGKVPRLLKSGVLWKHKKIK
ncbi:NAD(P)/FAD-dependent oxidoreductase [Exiguobacterium antarcticum]|uniref:NAD(P)/FAD-dependent oxidoreductase n=1 Tax=Exiguobacterium antarcticum TaxID=132920 RepID=UPI00047BF178|nr:FAD-dependent oxidoreductase [Exiguobacterium antarcticum]